MRLRFIIGTVADFAELGIDTAGCRTTVPPVVIEGEEPPEYIEKVLMHQENLTDAQFDAIITAIGQGKSFMQKSNLNVELTEMLTSTVWNTEGTSQIDELEDLLIEEMGL